MPLNIDIDIGLRNTVSVGRLLHFSGKIAIFIHLAIFMHAYVSSLTLSHTECSAPIMNHELFYLVQELGVTWWLFSPAESPLTCISTVLLGKFLMRPRAATTPAAHSVVQVSMVQAKILTI